MKYDVVFAVLCLAWAVVLAFDGPIWAAGLQLLLAFHFATEFINDRLVCALYELLDLVDGGES